MTGSSIFLHSSSEVRMRCHNLEDHSANSSNRLSRKTCIQFMTEAVNFLFVTTAIFALGPTLPCIQWVSGPVHWR
jgi:hypothetical protein